MKRKLLVIAGLALVVVAGFVLFALFRGGAFLTVAPHGPAPLRVVTGFPGGTEDLVIRPGGTDALVSSANFRDPTVKGGIFLVDIAAGTSRDVTPALDFEFQPHGIDLWVGPDGAQRLFVVNHRGGSGFTSVAGDVVAKHVIEVFDVAADGALTYVRSYESLLLNSPNDVAASGAQTFYATNDHRFGPGFARTLEDYLQLGLGNVVYFDGSAFREVHTGTKYANGIAVTADGTSVYLAETIGGRVTKFARDGSTGALTLVTQTGWVSGLDNLSIDTDGSVWVGAHPKLLAFVAHAADPSNKRSPSQVLRFEFGAPGEWSSQEIYVNDGTPISGTSAAIPGDGVILLGAVMESKVVVLSR